MHGEHDRGVLRIRDLHIEGRVGEAWQPIIRGIDLELRKGEILGVIGESGAGKSTLGLAAMGYVKDGCRISQGSILFDGQELTRSSQKQLRQLRGLRIAYVAQSAAAAFNPAHRLIDQQVESAVCNAGISRELACAEAIELYRVLGLADPETIGQRYPHQLSGGQLQRAMTAMALSCQPDLIIFDEPTTALDVTTQIDVLAAIRSAVERFATAALYISHDLAVVAQMADRIMVLRHGRCVEEAETRQMLSAPQADYTVSLWAVRTFNSEPRARIAGAEPLLAVEGVSAGYAGKPVLHAVSLQVGVGQTVAVIGESGSGKSTTARVISGLLTASAGRVRFNGALLPLDYRQRSREQLRQIQMIHQTPDTALNPRHTVEEILGRPLRFYLDLRGQARRARIVELLEMIELDPELFMQRRPGELSGGQKQRLCIARALAAEPRLVICDEVTSALDQLVAEGILRLLKRIQEQLGVSYLFITHDVATVRAISDEVVVMQHGRVVDGGPRQQIFTPPHAAYTALLFASEPQMDPDWLSQRLQARDRAAHPLGALAP